MSKTPSVSSVLIGLLLLLAQPAPASTALPEAITVNGVEFILIPAGWFNYHLERYERWSSHPDEGPHYRSVRVWLDDYYLAKYEATAQDLARFLNDPNTPDALRAEHTRVWRSGGEAEKRSGNGCTLQQDTNGRFVAADPHLHLPATYLTWPVARAFAEGLGFRLPTDAEWQKAARGTDQRLWPWGDSYPDDTYAHFAAGRHCQPMPVGSYPKGRSAYGLFDMAGNVTELVADWYDFGHDNALQDGARNPLSWLEPADETQPGRNRISHGGGWSNDPHSFPISYRRLIRSDRASNQDGVRFALDASTVRQLVTQHRETAP